MDDDEAQMVKQALRHYVKCSNQAAEGHESRGYTSAAWSYLRRAMTVQRVLKREFGE